MKCEPQQEATRNPRRRSRCPQRPCPQQQTWTVLALPSAIKSSGLSWLSAVTWRAGFPAGPAQPEPTPVLVQGNSPLQIKCSCDLQRALLFSEIIKSSLSLSLLFSLSLSLALTLSAAPTSKPRRDYHLSTLSLAMGHRSRGGMSVTRTQSARLSAGQPACETPTADDSEAQVQLERSKNKCSGELKA